ncbi:MAG: glycosyltransferase family 2 protein, partial [Terriglobales bacterium]
MAVRTVDLAEPIAPIEDVADYESTRIVILKNGAGLGSILIQNGFEPLTAARLSAELQNAIKDVQQVTDRDALRLPNDVPVSIIVPTCNRPTELRACLMSLLQQASDRAIEIIVVDNRPNSGMAPPVVQEFPSV